MTKLLLTLRERGRARRPRALRVLIPIFVLLLLLLFTGLRVPVRAGGMEDEALAQLEEGVEELLAALDTEALQEYLDGLQTADGMSVKERLLSMIKGDLVLDYGSLWEAVFSLVLEEGRVMLPAFALILAIALLCGVLNSAKSEFLHSTMTDIIHFVGYISVGAVILSVLLGVLKAGYSAVNGMQRQMEIVYPMLLTLMAASGGTVSATVYRPAVTFLAGAISKLFTAVVMPIAIIVIVLVFLDDLTKDVRTERLGELFKSVSKWLVGLTLGIFGIFLTVQGITSAQYDGISLRTAKYLISGSVPVVGGFLSGSVELVLAGSVLIKNALGSFAVFLLFATVLRPVLLFVAFQLFLRLCAAVTEPVGGKIPALFSRLARDSGYFVAAILCVGLLYFVTLMLLILSSGVIV